MTSPTCSLEAAYRARLSSGQLSPDPAQRSAVTRLCAIAKQLSRGRSWRTGWRLPPVRGAYLHGGTGSGKTLLMNLFYRTLPAGVSVHRTHFHAFMQQIHAERHQMRGTDEPIMHIAKDYARRYRVLCLDEFEVIDIADAMILHQLLAHLFAARVTLITTANLRPSELYRDGLQRARFLPAIDLLHEHTELIEVCGEDYRAALLRDCPVYLDSADRDTPAALTRTYQRLAGREPAACTLELCGRAARALGHSPEVVWFDAIALLAPPRAKPDYLALAARFPHVLLSDVPCFDADLDDAARRFIELIDVFYEASVKVWLSAACAPAALYRGRRLAEPFRRTASRLLEMQSREYQARGAVEW